ncbi:hypothetical protein GCM10009603_66070 [Nocardiopsis exhalans]
MPTKVTDGQKRVKPCEALSAAAHAVSRRPETTRTIQAMTCTSKTCEQCSRRLVLTGYDAPRPGSQILATYNAAGDPGLPGRVVRPVTPGSLLDTGRRWQ